MGQGIDLARGEAPVHAQILDDFKDQLLIVMVKKIRDLQVANGSSSIVEIPVSDVDATGSYLLAFGIENNTFQFELRKKQ